MNLFTGLVMSAGLVLVATAANAQGSGPRYTAASDIGEPYAVTPSEGPVPGYGPVPAYGPTLLPPMEVYTVLRENGFSPLGVPRRQGPFYSIAVVDRRGDDGRLVIDARNGQIVRFVPAFRLFGRRYEDVPRTYAPAGPLPPMTNLRDAPRPPAEVPRLASRMPTVPLPKASPQRPGEVKPLDVKPLVDNPAAQPTQQSAAMQVKPADAPATSPVSPPVVAAKPAAPPIQPTQEMPKMQGLE
jgi:hypothetical protein